MLKQLLLMLQGCARRYLLTVCVCSIWFPSQPDGGTNETCMIIHEHEGVLGVDDIHCDYQGTGAICEIGAEELLLGYTPLEKPIENNITKTDPYCPPEWSHYQVRVCKRDSETFF